MRISDLADLRVAIWGLGREGHAAYKALRERQPGLALTIFCADAEAHFLMDGNVLDRYITSAPTAADLSAFDLVIKSPGIGGYRPELLDAQRNGTRFTSATALWFAENPDARVIGVTGTKGKSTTSALIAHLLRGIGKRAALAGNIGLPVLELLDPPQAPDWWVLELSSFQTRQASHLNLGVITNIEEEHLDWHGNRERYISDKLAMADVSDVLLINANHNHLMQRTSGHARRQLFGHAQGWHPDASDIRRGDQAVLARSRLPLPGWHNALNACAALAALEILGEDAIAAASHIESFKPLPHRQQTLGERDSRIWIDDSIATTPQATIEALRSLPGKSVSVIIGGHERGLDWQVFADYVSTNPPSLIVVNGANAARIGQLLRAAKVECRVEIRTDLAEAVACARTETVNSGVILLSPGAPSFDQFHDYAERGRHFAELAGFDPEAIGQIEGLGIA